MRADNKKIGLFTKAEACALPVLHENSMAATVKSKLERHIRAYVGVSRDGTVRSATSPGDTDRSRNDEGDAYTDVNYLYKAINSTQSAVVPAKPQIQIRTLTPQISEVSAKFGEDVVNYIFRQQELRRRLIRMNALTMLHGISYLKTTWNGVEGTVDFQVASRADVFLDPLADTWKDLAYIIHKTTVPASTMRKRIESGIYALPENTPADKFLNRILTMPSTWGVNPGTRNTPDGGLGRPRRRAVLSEADEVAKHDRVGVVYELFDFIGNCGVSWGCGVL